MDDGVMIALSKDKVWMMGSWGVEDGAMIALSKDKVWCGKGHGVWSRE